MEELTGYKTNNDFVCKLNKSLYGLKQAPREWYKTIKRKIKEIGYKENEYDECFFIKETNKTKTYILLYVDDLLMITN